MSRAYRVLAIDPGKLTGVALLERDGDAVKIIWTDEINVFEDPGGKLRLRGVIDGWSTRQKLDAPLRVVIEKFVITPETGKKSQEATAALETIGAVKLMCVDASYPLDAIMWQKPSEAKETFPNPKLKRLGLWHRGGAGHALDALRHAAVYLVRVGWRDSRMFVD